MSVYLLCADKCVQNPPHSTHPTQVQQYMTDILSYPLNPDLEAIHDGHATLPHPNAAVHD
jgi:hypothetical protein